MGFRITLRTIEALVTHPRSGAAMRRCTCLPLALTTALVLAACEGAPPNEGGTGDASQSSSVEDATVTDGGVDAGAPDTGAPDTGAPDTGAPDTGAPDTGAPDTGAPDTGAPDTSTSDAGSSSGCTLPPIATYTKNPHVNRVSKLQLLGEKVGCDLDKDGVPDNVAGKIVGVYNAANDAIKDNLDDGSLVVLLRPTDWQTQGNVFDIEVLSGEVDTSKGACVPGGAKACDYLVNTSSFDQLYSKAGLCPPLVTFTPATVNTDQLEAGGTNQVFSLPLPVVGIALVLKISQAQITGTVTDTTSWNSTKKAMLCGVITKYDLDKAVEALPDNVLKETGFDKATIKSLIGEVLKPDIDTTGNNDPNAISIALGLETVAAKVTGYN